MNISDVGLKQDLVSRLVNKCKEKKKLCSSLFEKRRIENVEDISNDESGSYMHN
ncbi:7220_t:CDS:1, partial [Cetraspora pellucida]